MFSDISAKSPLSDREESTDGDQPGPDHLAWCWFRLSTYDDPSVGEALPGIENSQQTDSCRIDFSPEKGSMLLDGRVPETVFWNDDSRSLGWVAPGSKFCEGHITFAPDYVDVIGTVGLLSGGQSVVTGSVANSSIALKDIKAHQGGSSHDIGEEDSVAGTSNYDDLYAVEDKSDVPVNDDGPPAYSAVSHTPASRIMRESSRLEAHMKSPQVLNADTSHKVSVETFETERKPKSETSEDAFVMYQTVYVGADFEEVLKPVFYFGSEDVSPTVVAINGGKTIVKEPSNVPSSKAKASQITFTISFEGIGTERSFRGTLHDDKGEWDWRGKFSEMGTKDRSGPAGIEKDPDGHTLQGLLGVSSLKRQASSTAEDAPSVDLAQTAGDAIYGRILLASVPDETKNKLYPGLITLDSEEEKIRKSAQEFFARAGIYHLMQHLGNASDIDAHLRSKINLDKISDFWHSCAGDGKASTTGSGLDKDLLERMQTQCKLATLACYRLGYRRVIGAFHPFLKYPGYWYKRLATFLTSDQYATVLQLSVSAGGESGGIAYSHLTKLTLLKDAAEALNEGIGDAPDVGTVMEKLAGTTAINLLKNVDWDDTTKSDLLEFFGQVDLIEKQGGAELQKHKAYHRTQELMKERDGATWSELGKSTINFLERLRGNAKWSATEAASRMALLQGDINGQIQKAIVDEGLSEAEAAARYGPRGEELGFLKRAGHGILAHIRGAITMVAVYRLVKVLHEDGQTLDVAEKISMWGSLGQGLLSLKDWPVVHFVVATGKQLGRGLAWLGGLLGSLASQVGQALGAAFVRLAPARLTHIIRAIAEWSRGVIATATNWVRGAVQGAVGYAEGAALWVRNLPIAWGNVGKFALRAFGAILSLAYLASSITEVIRALRDGRGIDIGLSIAGLVIASVEVLVMVVHGIAYLSDAAWVCSACTFLGPILLGAGVILAIVSLVITLALREDPIKDFIEEYGAQYGLLK